LGDCLFEKKAIEQNEEQPISNLKRGNAMEEKKQLFDDLKTEVEKILDSSENNEKKLKAICELLVRDVFYYNWVGFYIVDGSERELVLGPFVGQPTEHVRIRFGEGICGMAAEMERTIVVQDVTRETKYLACAPEVRSEMVVPIFKSGKIAGELDIDSHLFSPFTWEDREFLEHICKIIPDLI
jgi:L-methionine (R)-S-oxide reductase